MPRVKDMDKTIYAVWMPPCIMYRLMGRPCRYTSCGVVQPFSCTLVASLRVFSYLG